MDLGGLWRVAAGTEAERRTFHEFDHDDSGWATMPVPSHWALGGAAGSDLAAEESVLYRHRFDSPDDPREPRDPGSPDRPDGSNTGRESGSTDRRSSTHTGRESGADADWDDPGEPFADEETEAGRRWWLRLDGVAQQGDVWLDGAYLGHTDGYFVPHELEVTEQLAARREHLLAIEATCRRFGDPDNRSTLTGALQDPELCGSDDLIVGGVWRPVRLRSSGPVAILHARAVCTEVRMAGGRGSRRGGGQARARLALRAVLDVPGGGAVYLRTRVAGDEHVHSHHAAEGENRVEWAVDVDDPPLWWPHALGEQPLCDLTMDAMAGGEVHDRRRFSIGFRSVEMRRWVLHVNGERLFVKGANVLPTSQLPGAASPSEVANDVRAARRAGLDMIRPLAHIARPELYDTADELGVLIWQDLPVRGVMSRSVAAEARRQAREAVDLLGHHPSVAVWCAHDDPFPRNRRPSATPPAVSRLGPSWNRDVLDRRLARVLSRCDGSRPVVAHTGVPPHFPSLEGTTSQLWFGLHGGRAADLAPTLARLPAMGQFVSAFGTPVAADQPEVVKTTIEILRRLKYRPTGGFLLHALADAGASPGARSAAAPANTFGDDLPGEHRGTGPGPGTNADTGPHPETNADNGADPESGTGGAFGVLDELRRPKPGWQALVDSCRPLIVVADPLPASVRPGDRLSLAVHVVNDTRQDADGMQVRARLIGPDGAVLSERRWKGSAPADDCAAVGRIDTTVPTRGPGTLTLELTLAPGGRAADGTPHPTLAANRYTTTIA